MCALKDPMTDRQGSRFFEGDSAELQEIRSKESLQNFVRHNQKKKTIGRLSLLILFVGMFALFAVVSLSLFFKVEEIRIEGSSRYSEEEILEGTGVERGQSLFDVSNRDFADVPERLTFLKQVTVKRELPHTLVLQVTEDKPRYYANFYDEYFLLSEDLRVLQHSHEADFDKSELTRLYLPDIDSVLVGSKVDFSDELIAKHTAAYLKAFCENPISYRVTAFDLRDRFDLAMICESIYLVNLGDGVDLSTKLSTVAAILETDAFDHKTPATINAVNPAKCSAVVGTNRVIAFDDTK